VHALHVGVTVIPLEFTSAPVLRYPAPVGKSTLRLAKLDDGEVEVDEAESAEEVLDVPGRGVPSGS